MNSDGTTHSLLRHLRHAPTPDDTLREKLNLDNRFRLALSAICIIIACALYALNDVRDLTAVVTILAAYSIPYMATWLFLHRMSGLRPLGFALSFIDFVAITAATRVTGGVDSPFFFLFPVPFLVHALHFDPLMIVFDGAVVVGCYVNLLRHFPGEGLPKHGLLIGQLTFLLVVIAAALYAAWQSRKREFAVQRGVQALRTTVLFLDAVNSLPLDLPEQDVQQRLVAHVSQLLKPFGIYSRLWIFNSGWKTLQGLGEHPALRPGSPHHLPMLACPAFALRRPFHYQQREHEPCPSEQFNYTKHVCLPIVNESESLGILFLGSYTEGGWSSEETHLFEMLAQSVAWALRRKKLFERLQEKIGELNFSFEVGTTGLASFVGSTQSIDETTVNILDGVLSILKVDRASLMLWDAEARELQTQWVRGGDFKIQTPMRLGLGEGMAGWSLQTGEPYWAEYAMGDPHYKASAQAVQSLICVPVYTIDREPLGVINAVTTQKPRVFSPREVDFLKWFGRLAAMAIENARLHHKNRSNIDQLHELNAIKSQFLSLVSHDLRGPLTGVRGFCELLKMQKTGPLSEKQQEVLSQLERQVDLQERMVDDLLDLARMEKGSLSIHLGPTDVEALIREEVEKSQPEARERGVTLTLATPSVGFPPIQLDGARMRQVVWNLIHNALKFTPEGGRVTVRVILQGEKLLLEVEDTGVGLSPETQERVFDKFFQVSPGGSKGAQGLGLGLAICKEIILAHRGRIRAMSPGLGLGTTIACTLPIAGVAVRPRTQSSDLAA